MTARPTLPPLPWDQVNEQPPEQVAQLLGLKPAREPHKFNCPVHGGSDSLHAYPGGQRSGFYCWGECDQAYSNVDLAAAVWRIEPAEACKQLASALGILIPEADPYQARRTTAGRTRRARPTNTLRGPQNARPAPSIEPVSQKGPSPDDIRAQVYRFVVNTITLTSSGEQYLESRSLPADEARTYGFRSLDGPRYWHRLDEILRERFTSAELEVAGLARMPFGGNAATLLIPFWTGDHGQVAALRLRRLDGGEPKYINLKGAAPRIPFNFHALRHLNGDTVHVTEGELDAFTLHHLERVAVGVPGVSPGRPLLYALARGLAGAEHVVAWYDADDAGDQGFRAFARIIQEIHGGAWLERRVVRRRIRVAKDPNELYQKGLLR